MVCDGVYAQTCGCRHDPSGLMSCAHDTAHSSELHVQT